MNLTATRLLKLLGIFFLSLALLIIPIKTLAAVQKIRVDVSNVLSDVSNDPVGIGLHFIADNPNVTNSLKDLKVGTLRFGTSEYYLFDKNEPDIPKVAIQDPDLAQVNSFSKPDGTWRGGLKKFDDFMRISQLNSAEPFIIIGIDAIAYTGYAPHASPEEVLAAAVEWVRYANIVKGYNVKYWEIGNESNYNSLNRKGQGKISWTPEKYAETVVKFSQAMKAVDPSIKIGANGMRFKKNDDWWDRIMPIIKDDVDFLITHQYSWIKNYQQWKNNVWDVTGNIEYTRQAIDTYNPNLRINITEIASLGGTGSDKYQSTWKMLHNFEVIATALCFDEVDYLHFWTSRWFGNPNLARNAFNSDYEPQPMSLPLKVLGNFLKKKMVYSSRSEPIRSWASYDPDDNSLNVFVLNKDKFSRNVSIKLDNYTGSTQNERWVLKGPTPQSIDVTWEKSGSVPVSGTNINTKLEPLSVTVIAFQGS